MPRPLSTAGAPRPRSFALLGAPSTPTADAPHRRFMRSQNFILEWIEAGAAGCRTTLESTREVLVIPFDSPVQVQGQDVQVPARAAGVLPAGRHVLASAQAGTLLVLACDRPDVDVSQCVNAADYVEPDASVRPVGTAYRRVVNPGQVAVYPLDGFAAPADNPRLKMLQTDGLSINWVEYDGPRDRTQLSPHSHADLEQGSLAIAGHFVHHLRTPWGKSADHWREDEHLAAPSPSLVVIPTGLVHTTEGVGDEHHLLIDLFAPPRADFIAKGWVHNAADYALA